MSKPVDLLRPQIVAVINQSVAASARPIPRNAREALALTHAVDEARSAFTELLSRLEVVRADPLTTEAEAFEMVALLAEAGHALFQASQAALQAASNGRFPPG